MSGPVRQSAILCSGDISRRYWHQCGLVTEEKARVIKTDGTFIPGLYAAGNNLASVMGNTYPGPGGTIGPSMTFGYIAAMDIVEYLRCD